MVKLSQIINRESLKDCVDCYNALCLLSTNQLLEDEERERISAGLLKRVIYAVCEVLKEEGGVECSDWE